MRYVWCLQQQSDRETLIECFSSKKKLFQAINEAQNYWYNYFDNIDFEINENIVYLKYCNQKYKILEFFQQVIN